MWRWLISGWLISLSINVGMTQDLFVISESATSIPQKSLVVRAYTNWYDEFGAARGLGALSLYYGLTSTISINMTVSGSNHHGNYLSDDLITHKHIGSQTIYYTQQVPRNLEYPFLIKGINLSAKYRFLNIDDHRKHFRMAVTGSYSTSNSAHDKAEANLIEDNAGYGAGLIASYLHDRKAITFTYQYLVPKSYQEFKSYGFQHDHHILLDYGNTQQFNLALGYLISPREYEDYSQPNTNLYLEIMGKKHQALEIFQNGEQIEAESPAHRASYYIDFMPGIQKVYDSRLILEFSIGFPFLNSSFSHTTPTYFLSIRRYLYF